MVDYKICVIGSGAAGLMAAIHAAPAGGCALVTDGPLGRSNSMMAQGGLQLPLPGEESLRRFAEDMFRSARGDLDRERVLFFVGHVAEIVQRLESWGLQLDRDDSGELVRRRAGGLSEARVVSVRDQIGPAIIKVLRQRLRDCPIDILEHTAVLDVQRVGDGFALSLRRRSGAVETLRARAVVCCSGGITYREALRRAAPTTNPENENHLLFDRLRDLGLALIHADYFQYQPFGIVETWGEGVGRCVPESIINLPVRMLDRHGRDIGEIRRDRYELTGMLFALADEGRAVTDDAGRRGFWLTLGELPPRELAASFPKVQQYLERAGRVGENLLVFPFLHYYLGGFRTGTRGETALPGLFLAGEMVGGLHGRNRLMGNGITDSLVHGAIAGAAVREYAAREAA